MNKSKSRILPLFLSAVNFMGVSNAMNKQAKQEEDLSKNLNINQIIWEKDHEFQSSTTFDISKFPFDYQNYLPMFLYIWCDKNDPNKIMDQGMKSLVVKDSSGFFKTLTAGPFKSIVKQKLHTKDQGRKHATCLMVEEKIDMTLGDCASNEIISQEISRIHEKPRKEIYDRYKKNNEINDKFTKWYNGNHYHDDLVNALGSSNSFFAWEILSAPSKTVSTSICKTVHYALKKDYLPGRPSILTHHLTMSARALLWFLHIRFLFDETLELLDKYDGKSIENFEVSMFNTEATQKWTHKFKEVVVRKDGKNVYMLRFIGGDVIGDLLVMAKKENDKWNIQAGYLEENSKFFDKESDPDFKKRMEWRDYCMRTNSYYYYFG